MAKLHPDRRIANALARLGPVKLAELELAALVSALEACRGNRTHAALQLGISIRTLQRKLKAAGLLTAIPPT
jgi:DNA-binding protein Fis